MLEFQRAATSIDEGLLHYASRAGRSARATNRVGWIGRAGGRAGVDRLGQIAAIVDSRYVIYLAVQVGGCAILVSEAADNVKGSSVGIRVGNGETGRDGRAR